MDDYKDYKEDAMLAAMEAGRESVAMEECVSDHALHHKSFKLVDLRNEMLRDRREKLAGPNNPAGCMTLLTPESFAQAILDHRDERTQVFADASGWRIDAVFDFLQGGGDEKRAMGWGQLKAELMFEESRKLREWRRVTEYRDQVEFAEFLEDHRDDVREPSGQELLELVSDLEATSTGSFKGKVNLDNGNVSLAYQDEAETSVAIPKELELGIPLFEHGEKYKLKARLRYRIHAGAVKFRLLFTNLEDAKEQEFERIVQEISEKAGQPIYRGSLALPWGG